MPGTIVSDALAPTLVDATIATNTTTNGTWTEVDYPHDVAARLTTGTLTGTDLAVDVEIQGADNGSGDNAVSYGRFAQLDASDDNVERLLNVKVYKPYVRAVVITDTSAGSPSVPIEVTLVQPHFRRTVATTA